MLKLNNVDKYFFKHKKNEIHVINNTSLELGDSGLVALLGPSGCGKTTLLNAIGGLDKINRGKIYINGKKLSQKMASKRDKIRVLNIGYIFQDYNILENLTVFENIALSLKMIGIKNRNEIKRKVEYVLSKVDMYRYRNKLAGMLSGGEKQRVAIARAIVKNPSIIIADEPTGNLDSKNTIEIMNIIKSISKDKLVILVTHEKDLAYFYATRIISIEDGKILSDILNDHVNELDYRIDNKIYLKDFANHKSLKEKNVKIELYSNDNELTDLKIVFRNNNIYIKAAQNKKVEVVDDTSGIELIDEHYKKISKSEFERNNFDLKELDNSNKYIHYSSIYNIFTMIINGFKKVLNYSKTKKVLLFGFFVSAMFIVYSISNIFGSMNIKDNKFITRYKDYIEIKNNVNKIEEVLNLESDEHIDYIIPGTSIISMEFILNEIYQFKGASLSIEGSLTSDKLVKNIIYGEHNKEKKEIVLDKMVIDRALLQKEFKMLNFTDYKSFIGRKLNGANLGEFTISGICDTGSPSIFVSEDLFTNLIAVLTNSDEDNPLVDYDLATEDIIIKKGHAPKEDYEVLVNVVNKDIIPLNKVIDKKVNNKKLKVVGYYYSPYDKNDYYVNANTIKYNNIKNNASMVIYSTNKNEAIDYLKEQGYNAVDIYEKR